MLALTAALSIGCGLLFGLVPALQSTRPDVMPALKTGAGGGPRRRAQHVLVVAQLAISFLLLVAAGLFVRTLDNLHAVQLGYTRENVLLFSLNARQAGHRAAEIPNFYATLRNRFASIPGVNAATLSQSSIVNAGFTGPAIKGRLAIGAVELKDARTFSAGPAFLATMRIPLLAGREFDDRDQPGAPPVAVVGERLARTWFPGENPVGKRITLPDGNRELEIVGVSANVRYGGLKNEDDNAMTIFVPATQFPFDRVTYALRTAGDPLAVVRTVREIARDADPRIPVTNVATQAAEIDRTINRELTFARLCGAFALLALLTACVGLYGTISYNVTRQSAEMGIRMALGARPGAVVWLVLRHTILLAAVGLAASVPAVLVAARLVQSFLFGVQPDDPAILAVAAIVLFIAATLAGYLPARRASRIDPLVALRSE